jgi:hypothetical protein
LILHRSHQVNLLDNRLGIHQENQLHNLLYSHLLIHRAVHQLNRYVLLQLCPQVNHRISLVGNLPLFPWYCLHAVQLPFLPAVLLFNLL